MSWVQGESCPGVPRVGNSLAAEDGHTTGEGAYSVPRWMWRTHAWGPAGDLCRPMALEAAPKHAGQLDRISGEDTSLLISTSTASLA